MSDSITISAMEQTQVTTHTISVREAAKQIGIGVNTAYELVRSNRLRSLRIGRKLLIPVKEVEAFIDREMENKE